MLIPKKLKVGKKWYAVRMLDHMPRRNEMGRTYYSHQLIALGRKPDAQSDKYMQVEIDMTFWHELTHAILYEMQSPLTYNERFVENFSFMLAKAVHTARF